MQGSPLQAGPLEDTFPTITSSYLRAYSDSHLAKHPDQTVARIALGPLLNGWAESPAYVDLAMTVLLRDGRAGDHSARCTAAGQELRCTSDGEFGSYTIRPTPDGIQLRLGPGNLTLEVPLDGDLDFVTLSGQQGDDRVFNIPATRSFGCP
jgi:hypothetical protein